MATVGPVERGIPIPPKQARRSALGLDDLKVGDSRPVYGSSVNKVSARASDHAMRHGRRYTVRSEADGAVRVWRTA